MHEKLVLLKEEIPTNLFHNLKQEKLFFCFGGYSFREEFFELHSLRPRVATVAVPALV